MMFKVDLHVHSKFSGDNDSEPEELIIQAIARGLHGIAFTEHYSYEASEPIESLREKYEDRIRVFRGVEFSSAEGHCLIFGVNTDRFSMRYAPAQELTRMVNEAGGVLIPSHPYRKGTSLEDLIQTIRGICAIEGYNGCNMDAYNMKAVETAKALNLPYTGGSDAHFPEEVGSCFTAFSDEVTHENFIHLIRKGTYVGVDNRNGKRTRVIAPRP